MSFPTLHPTNQARLVSSANNRISPSVSSSASSSSSTFFLSSSSLSKQNLLSNMTIGGEGKNNFSSSENSFLLSQNNLHTNNKEKKLKEEGKKHENGGGRKSNIIYNQNDNRAFFEINKNYEEKRNTPSSPVSLSFPSASFSIKEGEKKEGVAEKRIIKTNMKEENTYDETKNARLLQINTIGGQRRGRILTDKILNYNDSNNNNHIDETYNNHHNNNKSAIMHKYMHEPSSSLYAYETNNVIKYNNENANILSTDKQIEEDEYSPSYVYGNPAIKNNNSNNIYNNSNFSSMNVPINFVHGNTNNNANYYANNEHKYANKINSSNNNNINKSLQDENDNPYIYKNIQNNDNVNDNKNIYYEYLENQQKNKNTNNMTNANMYYAYVEEKKKINNNNINNNVNINNKKNTFVVADCALLTDCRNISSVSLSSIFLKEKRKNNLIVEGWLYKIKNKKTLCHLNKFYAYKIPFAGKFLQSNKRFVTLDFQDRLFFYSHFSNSKQISFPLHFYQILSVNQLESPSDRRGWLYAFEICTEERSFYFATNCEFSFEKWMHAFTLASGGSTIKSESFKIMNSEKKKNKTKNINKTKKGEINKNKNYNTNKYVNATKSFANSLMETKNLMRSFSSVLSEKVAAKVKAKNNEKKENIFNFAKLKKKRQEKVAAKGRHTEDMQNNNIKYNNANVHNNNNNNNNYTDFKYANKMEGTQEKEKEEKNEEQQGEDEEKEEKLTGGRLCTSSSIKSISNIDENISNKNFSFDDVLSYNFNNRKEKQEEQEKISVEEGEINDNSNLNTQEEENVRKKDTLSVHIGSDTSSGKNVYIPEYMYARNKTYNAQNDDLNKNALKGEEEENNIYAEQKEDTRETEDEIYNLIEHIVGESKEKNEGEGEIKKEKIFFNCDKMNKITTNKKEEIERTLSGTEEEEKKEETEKEKIRTDLYNNNSNSNGSKKNDTYERIHKKVYEEEMINPSSSSFFSSSLHHRSLQHSPKCPSSPSSKAYDNSEKHIFLPSRIVSSPHSLRSSSPSFFLSSPGLATHERSNDNSNRNNDNTDLRDEENMNKEEGINYNNIKNLKREITEESEKVFASPKIATDCKRREKEDDLQEKKEKAEKKEQTKENEKKKKQNEEEETSEKRSSGGDDSPHVFSTTENKEENRNINNNYYYKNVKSTKCIRIHSPSSPSFSSSSDVSSSSNETVKSESKQNILHTTDSEEEKEKQKNFVGNEQKNVQERPSPNHLHTIITERTTTTTIINPPSTNDSMNDIYDNNTRSNSHINTKKNNEKKKIKQAKNDENDDYILPLLPPFSSKFRRHHHVYLSEEYTNDKDATNTANVKNNNVHSRTQTHHDNSREEISDTYFTPVVSEDEQEEKVDE